MIIIAGPCQLETVDHALMMAGRIAEISERLGREIIFKSSFDKANRTSGNSPRGMGLGAGRAAFEMIKRRIGCRIVTDVHEAWQVDPLVDHIDIFQIPAMLCRQTDLIEAVARTGRDVNIKKGQFLAAEDMLHAVMKARMSGADNIYATERGTTFGYRDLVVDMRSIAIMKRSGADGVIFDCTHSVQSPGGANGQSGGNRSMTETLARAAIAAGADGIFVETHQDPSAAPSDGAVMMHIDQLEDFLKRMIDLHAFVGEFSC